MKAVKLVVLLMLGLILSTSAQAKDVKIAYVELGGVFNNYQKTKAYDTKLQKESQDVQKQMEDMVKKFRDEQGKLALLKEDEKQKLQASLEQKQKEIIDFRESKKTELAKKFEDMRKEIIIEIEKVVSDIAKKDGYTFILNDTVILYGEKESNITEQVLKALNDSYPSKK